MLLDIKKENLFFFLIMDSSNNVSTLQVLDTINQVAADNAVAQCSDTMAVLQSQDGTNLANMANNERLGLHVDDSIHRTNIATQDSVERNADRTVDTVNFNAAFLSSAIERNGHDGVRTALSSNNELSNLIQVSTDEIGNAQQGIALESRYQLQQQHYAVINSSKDVVINENNNATDIELHASKNVFKTKEALAHVESTLELQAVTNTAQVQYEAVKLNAEAAAEMAECCCELKEEVAKSNYETQKLSRNIEMQRLRDQLTAATTESLVSKLQSRYSPCPCPPVPAPVPAPVPPQ